MGPVTGLAKGPLLTNSPALHLLPVGTHDGCTEKPMPQAPMAHLRCFTLSVAVLALAGCPVEVPPPTANPCDQVTCSNHGTCILQGGDTATCACDENYVADSVNGLSCLPVGGGGGGADAGGGGGGADAGDSSRDGGALPDTGGNRADAGTAGGGPDAGLGPDFDAGPGDEPVEPCDLGYCGDDNRAEEDGVVCMDDHVSFHPSLSAVGGHSRMLRTTPVGGEPVVTDQLSELMWTGCALGLSGSDCTNGSRQSYGYDGQVTACEELNWGGFDDWVVPNGNLMNALLDRRDRNPMIPEAIFPNLVPFDSSLIYSGVHTDRFWLLYVLQTGASQWHQKNAQARTALCVRATNDRSATGQQRRCYRTDYNQTAEPTAEDLGTGLVWQSCIAGTAGTTCQNGSPASKTYSQAVSYCEELVWGNHDDWMLPSMDQLISIRTARETPGNTGAQRFPEQAFGNLDRHVWASNPMPREGFNNFWNLEGSNSQTYGRAATGSAYVFCVRPGPWSYAVEYPERVCRSMEPFRTAQDRDGQDLQLTRRQSDSPGEYIVHDPYMGLQWTGCPEGLSGNECQNGAAVNGSGGEEFELSCQRLMYGGLEDWRAPTLVEMRSLHDYESTTPITLPGAVQSAFPGLVTSTTLATGNRSLHTSASYSVNFNGYVSESTSGHRYCVRDDLADGGVRRRIDQCVNTTAWTQTEGTITQGEGEDALQYMACLHGLNGRGCTNGSRSTETWAEAERTCNELGWAGHNDWRLPTYTETLRIYDVSRYNRTPIDYRSFPLSGLVPGDWTSSVMPDEEKVRRALITGYHSGLGNSRSFFCVRAP